MPEDKPSEPPLNKDNQLRPADAASNPLSDLAAAISTPAEHAETHPTIQLPQANSDGIQDSEKTGSFRTAGNSKTISTSKANEPVSSQIEKACEISIPGISGLKLVDQGGMGLVYEGYDVLGRHLAIKMIRASRMSATSLARFQEEAEAMAHLEHDNIAQVLSFGTVNGDPYYVMKYFKGGSLAKRMAEFQKDPKKSLLLIAKISNAVEFLHSKGHLHRDIKPQNILLDENDEPHLSDFGLVKRVTEDPALQDESSKDDFLNLTEQSSVETTSKIHKTAAGFFLGTPGYSSPEQAKGLLNAAGPHWDTWSLGVILYELMTGRKPFPSNRSNNTVRPSMKRMPRLLLKSIPRWTNESIN